MTGSRFVELSHRIEDGMVTYPGLPAPVVSEHLSRAASEGKYAPGTTFSIGRVEMVANTGTYVDAPFHRFEQGTDIAGLSLERLANLPGLYVDGRGRGRALDADLFGAKGSNMEGRAVLIATGWDAKWRLPGYGTGHPFLTRPAAERLVDARPALVGIDSVNIDDTADLSRPAHTLLLEAGIPIIEHLTNLDQLRGSPFRFFAVPPPFVGMGSFPVRAFAIFAS
jgi:kynurenine formamidase